MYNHISELHPQIYFLENIFQEVVDKLDQTGITGIINLVTNS